MVRTPVMNQPVKSEPAKTAWSAQNVPKTRRGMGFCAMSSEVENSPSGAMMMANWSSFAATSAEASETCGRHMTKALAFHSATPRPHSR